VAAVEAGMDEFVIGSEPGSRTFAMTEHRDFSFGDDGTEAGLRDTVDMDAVAGREGIQLDGLHVDRSISVLDEECALVAAVQRDRGVKVGGETGRGLLVTESAHLRQRCDGGGMKNTWKDAQRQKHSCCDDSPHGPVPCPLWRRWAPHRELLSAVFSY